MDDITLAAHQCQTGHDHLVDSGTKIRRGQPRLKDSLSHSKQNILEDLEDKVEYWQMMR